MHNSRLDRILYIQQVLVQGGVLNKQQTADRFGVSEKTIQRDLDTLRNHFADSEPRREILYNSAKGGYLLDDTLSRFLTSSANPGKIVFVKNQLSRNIIVRGNLMNANDRGTKSETALNGVSSIYIFDGSYWVHFFCG